MALDIKELLKKWLEGTLSNTEAEIFLKAFRDPEGIQIIEAWLQEQYDLTQRNPTSYFSNKQKNAIYKHATRPPNQDSLESAGQMAPPKGLIQLLLPHTSSEGRRRRKKRFIRLVSSLCIAGCLVFLFYKINRPPTQITANKENLVSLHDKAAPVLATPTISWGSQHKAVAVDQAIKEQANRLHKAADGCLVFTAVSSSAPPSIVTVPRGSRPVQIQLPDGSKVWINTGSSLTFPSAFVGNKRMVSLTGEAYFEVVHNNKQLFEVEQAGNTIAVLGTHFNINAYADNGKTKVTLLEGLVQVNHNAYLHPAEQAVLNEGNINIQKEVDLQQVMAWKHNQFYFNGTSAQEILRQLSRWYNIDILYKGNIPQGHYSGIINKDNSLSQVLTILEAGGMKFKLNQQSLWIY